MQRTVSQWIIALALAMVASLMGGNAGAQTEQEPEEEHAWGYFEGIPMWMRVEDSPPQDAFTGLTRNTEGMRQLIASIRGQRRAHLIDLQRARSQGRAEDADRIRTSLAELECGTFCISRHDQEWCVRHHLNEWTTLDLTLPCNPQTSVCQVCTEHGGECQWRPVQAPSVWTCRSLIERGYVERTSGDAIARAEAAEATDVQTTTTAYAVAERAQAVAAQVTQERDAIRVQFNAAVAQLQQVRTELAQVRADNGETAPSPPPRARRHSRERRTHTATPPTQSPTPATSPSTTPEPPEELICEAARSSSNGSYTARCEMPEDIEATIRRNADRLHRGSASMAGLDSLHPRLRRYKRQIAQILEDNGRAAGCNGGILFACHADTPAAGEIYFHRRIGGCNEVNGDNNRMTLQKFVDLATTACSRHPEITLQGVNGQRVTLRFDGSVPTASAEAAADDRPTTSRRAAASTENSTDTVDHAVACSRATVALMGHIVNGVYHPLVTAPPSSATSNGTSTLPQPVIASAFQTVARVLRPVFAHLSEAGFRTINTCPVAASGSMPSSSTCGTRVASSAPNLYTRFDGPEAPHGTPGRYQFLTD